MKTAYKIHIIAKPFKYNVKDRKIREIILRSLKNISIIAAALYAASVFAGGPDDDFEIEGGDVVTDDNIQQWLAVIPESIKTAYSQLIKKY